MKVVLASDGKAPAEAAERLLTRLARRDRTALHVATVCGFETVLAEAERVGRYDPAAGRRRAEAVLAAALGRLRGVGLAADGSVLEGDPAGEILAAAARVGAALVAVGAGHSRWLENLVLGSTSTTILHTAPQSVLVVHTAGTGPGRVLVGTDGSEGSTRAVRALAALVDPARASVRVLAVDATPAGAASDVRRSAGESAREAADAAGRALGEAGFDVDVEVAEGDPIGLLIDRAAEHDLVVVGSRGLGAVRRALIGSVSDALARRAPATLVGR